MTSVTAIEFQNNFSKYLRMVSDGDILISDGGKVIARLTLPEEESETRKQIARSLFGIIPPDISLEEARAERLKNI